jgi:hypothetical protein
MLIPLIIGSTALLVWMKGTKKTTTSLTLLGPTAAASVKLGGTVGCFPPPGGAIISVSPAAPATKVAAIANAITPAVAQVVAPNAVAPTAKAAAVNVVSETPNTLAVVTSAVTPAIASVVPAPAVPAAATAAAANIVSSVPTTQASLAAAIAPTLLDTVHPDNVLSTANAAASTVTSSLVAAHDAMAITIAPAIAAVVPSAGVDNATDAAIVTTMAGEAGSFMLNPRHMQSWMQGDWDQRTYAHPSQGDEGMWGGGHHNIYRPEFVPHAFGRGYSSTWGADVEEAKQKAGSGKQCVLKPTLIGSSLYTVSWKDGSGKTQSTIVNVTATP